MPAAPDAVACGACGICYSAFTPGADDSVSANSVPRLLPCGHSICTGCAQTCVEKGTVFTLPIHSMSNAAGSSAPDASVAAVTCPCGCGHTPVGEGGALMLPVDIAAAEWASENTLASQNVPVCEECEDGPATLWCELCSSEFCEACFAKVHAPRVMRKHKPVPIAEKPPPPDMCPVHHRQERTLWCTNCQRKVCALCTDERFEGRHVGEGHVVIPLEDAAQAAADRLRAQMHKLNAKRTRLSASAQRAAATLAGMAPARKHAAAAVSAHFAELRSALLAALEQREQALLKEASHVCTSKEAVLRGQVADLGIALSRIGRACTACDLRLRGNPVEALEQQTDFARLIGDAQRAAESVKMDERVESTAGVPLQFNTSVVRQLAAAVMTHGIVGKGEGPRVTAVTAGADGPVETPVPEEDEKRARRQLGIGKRSGARLQGRPLLASTSPRARGSQSHAADPPVPRRRRQKELHFHDAEGAGIVRASATLPPMSEQRNTPPRKEEDVPSAAREARMLLASSHSLSKSLDGSRHGASLQMLAADRPLTLLEPAAAP